MSAADDRLDQHRVVGVMEGQQLVSLIGKGTAGLVVVGLDLLGAVVDLAGCD